MSRQEKFKIHNTLTFIPMMLTGKGVLIDLRNETSVAGRIFDVDGFMNITLREVVFIDQKGLQYPFDEFMVPARMLRHIVLQNMNLTKEDLKNFIENYGVKRNLGDTSGKKTFKMKRALESHKKTLKEIELRKRENK